MSDEIATTVVMYLGVFAISCWHFYRAGKQKADASWRQEVSDLRQQLTKAHFDRKREVDLLEWRLNRSLWYGDDEQDIELASAIARTVGLDPDMTQRALAAPAAGGARVSTQGTWVWELYRGDAKELLKALRQGKF